MKFINVNEKKKMIARPAVMKQRQTDAASAGCGERNRNANATSHNY